MKKHKLPAPLAELDWDDPQLEAVALSRSTKPSTLCALASSQSDLVREYVAENPSTPRMAQKELAKDQWWEVRLALTRNPSVTKTLLKDLAGDKNTYVSSAAASALAQRSR